MVVTPADINSCSRHRNSFSALGGPCIDAVNTILNIEKARPLNGMDARNNCQSQSTSADLPVELATATLRRKTFRALERDARYGAVDLCVSTVRALARLPVKPLPISSESIDVQGAMLTQH
jgi:hypothetical protein